jgi:tRNA(adenine34) deaminase
MCAGLLVHSRIKRVVYATADLKTGAAGSAFNLLCDEKHNHQTELDSGIMAEECSQLLSAFFKRRRAEKKVLKQKAKLALKQTL